ncbi:MAG: GGDEF domain-containing phosphodiesterase, partial [Acidobacteriota bacterium]|nr:GGDEF domain-containing phosphodiesterase [Acidobacteriota bacterium]
LARIFQTPVNAGNLDIPLSASVGAALYPIDGDVPMQLRGRAEEAAKQARDAGGNQLRFYSDKVDSAVSDERTLGEDLERAITENQLDILFQPVFDLTTRAIIGARARPLWRHPERGIVPASTFLPAAEQHGTSAAITDWTIRETLRRTAGWRPVAPGVRVTVPISWTEIRRRTLVPHLIQILDDTGFEACHLELGIGEEFLVTQPPMTAQLNLQRLSQFGIFLTLENFGLEYASMMAFRKMPVHRIKIDSSLVAVVSFEKEAQAIVKATIDLARSCGLEVSADGIEDESQWRWLRFHGCEIGQGRFLADFLTGQEVFEKLVNQRL